MLAGGPLTVEKAERICWWYLVLGFLGLPWLWGMSWMYFRRYAGESDHIRRYTDYSLKLSIVGVIVIVILSVSLNQWLPDDSSLWILPPSQ